MCVIFNRCFACWIDGGSFTTCGKRGWCERALGLCGRSNFHRILDVELFPFTRDLLGWRTREKTSYTFFLQRALRMGKKGFVWDFPHWLHTDIDHVVILACNVSDHWICFKRCRTRNFIPMGSISWSFLRYGRYKHNMINFCRNILIIVQIWIMTRHLQSHSLQIDRVTWEENLNNKKSHYKKKENKSFKYYKQQKTKR
jgi:hypothetical protein